MSPRIHAPLTRPLIQVFVIYPFRHPISEHGRGTNHIFHFFRSHLCHHLMDFAESTSRVRSNTRGILTPPAIQTLCSNPEKRRISATKITGHADTVARRSKSCQILSCFISFYRGFIPYFKADYYRGFESLPFRQLIFNKLRSSVANSVAKEVHHDL